MSRKEELVSAFRSLKVRSGLSNEAVSEIIEIASDKLSLMAGPHSTTVPEAFRNASVAEADTERKKLAHLARELAGQIEELHKPTVIALAEAGILRIRLNNLALELKAISALAASAKIDLNCLPTRQGRPTKGPIKTIRRVVSDTYYRITGDKPSAVGEFLRLSRLLINILDLDYKPDGFAKAAYEDFHGEPLSD